MPERRLAAIGVVDVVGFSSLMAEDEEGTLATLRAHNNALDPILLNHGGRVVKGTGDGMLVEVPSAVEAVKAAIEMQTALAERNASAPEGRQMQMRIGINLGDVIVQDDGDVFGDGVNVAARLEAHADPGGVCVSSSIYNQVAGRVDCEFEDLGELEVKGIPRPIRAYRVAGLASETSSASGSRGSSPSGVAVLPFANQSGDPEQAYFAEGISEDLITALSHFEDLRVSSKAASFAVHAKGLGPRDAARELDAAYLIDGSVRQAGNRVRVSVQLSEAETGSQVWAERYDRELTDIFVVQDEIVAEVIGHIRPNVHRAELRKKRALTVDELEAHDIVLRSRRLYTDGTEAGTKEAIGMLEAARERFPNVAAVALELASAWITAGFNRWHIDDRRAFEEVAKVATDAARLDPTSGIAAGLLGFTAAVRGDAEEAFAQSQRALSLSPHDPLVLLTAGQGRIWRGDHEGAVDFLSEAWSLARYETWRFHLATNLSFAHYLMGNYEAAFAWAQRGSEVAEYLQLRLIGAAALGQLGRGETAGVWLGRILENAPGITRTAIENNARWRREEDLSHYLDGLEKAGLPE